MATIRFYGEFKDEVSDVWRINLHDIDYNGTATEITLGSEGFELSYAGNNEDRHQPIIGSSVEFTVMNEGGTFSGMVKGPDGGDGMSDDVAFDIKDDGQGGPDKALLSKDEYVIDAHSMSLLGNGSSDAGADQMDKFIKDLRKSGFGTTKQPKQLDGAEELSKLL